MSQIPSLPKSALRGDDRSIASSCRSPHSVRSGKGQSPTSGGRLQNMPRYRSAMLDGSPKSARSRVGPVEQQPFPIRTRTAMLIEGNAGPQTRRQRTAMLPADSSPQGGRDCKLPHSRTAMLPASKSFSDSDLMGKQKFGRSVVGMISRNIQGLVASARHRC
eukprot:TRINITY_DN6216_c0_g1_i1.p1 TRINITY_DN6216_c0_g1~~TRINITY_DN6216_c0_g1_i1.p1  ORF type:complete len:162 (+),score=11.61 TRINITY_DN6216_c0_g1_i1:48-533(+)